VISSPTVAIVAVVSLVVCAGRPFWLAVLVILEVVCGVSYFKSASVYLMDVLQSYIAVP
jgi:uncharacterized membrane protein YdbT with pleckstrin-like domain